MDEARARKLEEGRRKLAALRGKKKSTASCAGKRAVGDWPGDCAAVHAEPPTEHKQFLRSDAVEACAPKPAEVVLVQQKQNAGTSAEGPAVSRADDRGPTVAPAGCPAEGATAVSKGSNDDSGAERCDVRRWLDERNKRMRVVLAAALEMEHAVASASCAQANFDPYMTSGGSSRGAKLHALLRSAHEVVQRLEGSGIQPGTEKEETCFPAVSDVLQHLRAANARAKALELSASSSATGEVAPLGVGGKESPKSQNSSQGHPPNDGPEKPNSSTHRRYASVSSSGDLEDDTKDHVEAEAHRSGGYKAAGGIGGAEGGGVVEPLSIFREPMRKGTSDQSILSLWESPLDVGREGLGGNTSDQMSASELRRAAGGERGAGDASGGVFSRGSGARATDPWDDAPSRRHADDAGKGRRSAVMGGGVEGSGGGGDGGRGSVEQLVRAAGGLSDEANGVVRELTWENSSLQRRVEVQASALIELSVEKERWVAERASIQQRERDADARAKLMLEEKTQLKESLQAVIEALLEENVTLKTGGVQPAVPQLLHARAPPPALPAGEGEAQAQERAQDADPAPERLVLPSKDAKHSRHQRQAQLPTPQPHIAPFLGVAIGEPALVGAGNSLLSGAAATSARTSPLQEDVKMVEGPSGVKGGGEDGGLTPSSPSGKTLEWSLLLSPDGPAVPDSGGSSGSVERGEKLEGAGEEEAIRGAVTAGSASRHARLEQEDAAPHTRQEDAGAVSVAKAQGANSAAQPTSAHTPVTPPPHDTTAQAPLACRNAPPSRPFPPELLAHPGDKDIQIELRHLTNPPPPAPPAAPVILYVAAGVDSILDTLWGVVSLRPVRSTAARVLGFSREVEADQDDVWLVPSMHSHNFSSLRPTLQEQPAVLPAGIVPEPERAEFVAQVHAFETSSSLLQGYTPEVTPRKQKLPEPPEEGTLDAKPDAPLTLAEAGPAGASAGGGEGVLVDEASQQPQSRSDPLQAMPAQDTIG